VAGGYPDAGGIGHRADKAALPGRILTASDGAAGDHFGSSVAASGSTLLVGAVYAAGTGQAYVFIKVSLLGTPTWSQLKILAPAELDSDDFFGGRVALSGDTAIVGASHDDDGGEDAGAAYLFDRHQGGTNQWGLVAKLVADDAETEDNFGQSVAISGDTVVVGVSHYDSYAGCAYIFERNQGGSNQWGQVTRLTPSDGDLWPMLGFGNVATIDGDTVAVSTYDDSFVGTPGHVYVYQRDWGGVGNWGEVAKLTPSDGVMEDRFGSSLVLHGDLLLVGSYLHDGGATNGGAVYLFQRGRGGLDQWGQVAKIMPSDLKADDFFGKSVAFSSDGETFVVGAPLADDVAVSAGAAYLFTLGDSIGDWHEVFKITPQDAANVSVFGSSVATGTDFVLIGAPNSDYLESEAGSAHVYEGLLFANGFEGGDTSLWSSTTP
jgi:hypothetical protein